MQAFRPTACRKSLSNNLDVLDFYVKHLIYIFKRRVWYELFIVSLFEWSDLRFKTFFMCVINICKVFLSVVGDLLCGSMYIYRL